jgi:hypothetical protein
MEYLATPERLVTFVVRRDGITVLDTAATPDAIAARVRLARDMLGRKSDGPPAPVLGALHELLIAPAEHRGLLEVFAHSSSYRTVHSPTCRSRRCVTPSPDSSWSSATTS